MADKNDGGDKTELPTQKRLRDAKKKGDVPKSKDVGAAFVSLFWLVLILLVAGFVAREVVSLTQITLEKSTTLPFDSAFGEIMIAAAFVLIKLSLITLVPIALLATFVEFAQIGPIMTTEKLKPSLDKLNPMEGLKRMFGIDGLVELVKTLVKAILIVVVMAIVLQTAIEEVGSLINLSDWSPVVGAGPAVAEFAMTMTYNLTVQMFALVVIVFLFIAIADRLYIKHSFIKKMKMSMRDIRQEHKDDEGDPYIKSSRRQMHQEWAGQNAVGATGGSAALLVNPTHIAIALDYDVEECPVPVVAAKGAGPLAAAMRAEAERMGVPIIRNIVTARRLWSRAEVGEIIPEEMLGAIAEVILWAKKARAGEAPMSTDLDGDKPAFIVAQEIAA
jgi:type III secretion protein U